MALVKALTMAWVEDVSMRNDDSFKSQKCIHFQSTNTRKDATWV